ncbi:MULTISPECIES: ThiF family adenylyltransferase [Spirulina sp. CCY15215]|uniref:ThiF family adenylyltransferase n=1 Tax=Spirulina sp. CCY15215 TaxID=2767591 RepID=UPI00194E0746|nr:ThiF family adenylyltransferase [Spirulina major]
MLLSIAQINFFLASLAQKQYLREAYSLSPLGNSLLQDRNVVAAIAGNITIAEKIVQLCVGVREDFPRSLPLVFLQPPDAFGFIPHVEESGYICYAQTEGLLLNSADPVGILYDAIDKAIAVIQSGIDGENRWDFMDELPWYWERVNTKTLPGFFSVDNMLRKVFVYSDRGGDRFVADSIQTIQAYFNGKKQGLNALNCRGALYIPLEKKTFILPPTSKQLWNSATISELIKNLSLQNRQKYIRLLNKRRQFKDFIILGLPRPSGGRTLAALDSTTINRSPSNQSAKMSGLPQPISIKRYDPGYLLPRGGGKLDLVNFRVLLIGCGSIGGYVALGLVQSGIRQLTLVDSDRLTRENTYRHCLGMSAEGEPKVTALKNELERKYPYISIASYQTLIEKAIRQNSVNLDAFDLIIVAIGDDTAQLYLNQLLHKECQHAIAVFTWVEPYGIGGHSLLTRPKQLGCFQCLFTDASNPDTPLHNRAAFAAYGHFGKDDLGCGSSYHPFGGLDAQKTAEKAVRLGLDALLQQEKQSSILSWKGRAEAFTAAGLQLSPRYQQTEEQLREKKYEHIKSHCLVCGAKQE